MKNQNQGTCPQVIEMNNIPIPSCSQIKYFGFTIDSKLTWKPHIVNSRLHLIRPLLRSKMNIDTKLLIYKSLLKPLWTYGNQLWEAEKPSNIRSIQAFQSICLQLISSASWYIGSNSNLHKNSNPKPII